jgi:outer membrane protein assembly factor BamB
MRPALSCLWLASFFAGALVQAEDAWPQFRGPTQQGLSSAHGLPLTWSETEHVKWKTEIPGEGWSSPVVAHGQIWMTTALEDGHSLHAVCVDFATGKIVHDTEVFHSDVVPEKHARNSYASPTPIIGEDRVFVHFGSMGTAALDLKSGAKLWENRELKVEFQNGAGGSPLLYKNRLLIACDGMDFQYEVALDVETGRIVWKTERSAIPKLQNKPADMRKAYPTPVLIKRAGHDETITVAAERVYSYDPATGKELWYVDIPGFSNVPLPVWNESLLVFATGFGKPQLWGMRLAGARGDATANVAWKLSSGAPAEPSPLLVDGRVYTVSDSGIALCVEAASGRQVWKERIGSDFAASPVLVDGRIYFCDTAGTTIVIAPSDAYTELARNRLEAGFMASPAIVGKSFILRTKKALYRIEE